MNEQRVRSELAAALRFQHERLIEARRKDREIRAKLDKLYDPTFWDTRHTVEEMRQHDRDRDEAQRASHVSRTEVYVRESAIDSLRCVADALKPRWY